VRAPRSRSATPSCSSCGTAWLNGGWDITRLSGPAEVQGLGHGQEVAGLPDFDHQLLRISTTDEIKRLPAHGMRVRLVPPTVCSMRWPMAASMLR
jgi:hypothetical protein